MEGHRVVGDKPAGGFVPISVVQLFSAWCCYDSGVITLFDLRVWFALHEIKARRCCMRPDRKPKYSIAEIMTLTHQSRRSLVTASVGRLQEAGLVKCRRSSIVFADSVEGVLLSKDEFEQRLEKIKNRRRRVPVPRTVIKLIAAGGRRVLIATILGHLFRLLYLRSGACRADGNCKASWIAEVFAIDVRSVKQARRVLVGMGMLSVQPMPQWYANRYGWRGAVNLCWKFVDNPEGSVGQEAKKRPPPQPQNCVKPSPPIENQYLSTRNKNKQPASRRIGSCRRKTFGKVSAPAMRNGDDMKRLFAKAVQEGLVRKRDELNFFAAAEHSMRVGTQNPPGLFVWLVVNRKWDFVTQLDEDAARRRLKGMQWAANAGPKHAKPSGLTKASELVGACLQTVTKKRLSSASSCVA